MTVSQTVIKHTSEMNSEIDVSTIGHKTYGKYLIHYYMSNITKMFWCGFYVSSWMISPNIFVAWYNMIGTYLYLQEDLSYS
jgi:hypothetical protein